MFPKTTRNLKKKAFFYLDCFTNLQEPFGCQHKLHLFRSLYLSLSTQSMFPIFTFYFIQLSLYSFFFLFFLLFIHSFPFTIATLIASNFSCTFHVWTIEAVFTFLYNLSCMVILLFHAASYCISDTITSKTLYVWLYINLNIKVLNVINLIFETNICY